MATGSKLVSVVLPCHNAGRFLPPAIDSVLAQSHTELDVVAIDDASNDSTRVILEQYARNDDRIRVLANRSNLGLIETLNRAVGAAKGDFIARMDADDVCAPKRIERQLETLVAWPEIGVVGTRALMIDEAGESVGEYPVRSVEASATPFLALLATPAIHPTIMARSHLMRAYPYRHGEDSLHVEDYDLFTRMLAGGVQLINLDEPLYLKRVHPARVSLSYEQDQVDNFVTLARPGLERVLGARLSSDVCRVLLNRTSSTAGSTDILRGLRSLDQLRDAFLAKMGEQDGRGKAEVAAIADQQRVDILGQALLKGTWLQRLAAGAGLFWYGRALASSPSRRHIASKLRPWRSWRRR